jgi:hypothetical protein
MSSFAELGFRVENAMPIMAFSHGDCLGGHESQRRNTA